MKILDDFKKPFNLLSFVLTILSIVISIFFYFNSLKKTNISYVLNDPPSIIYDSENYSSEIKLLIKDSLLATENVYLLTGTVWNSGDLSIYSDNVRKNIELNIGNNLILDYKITKSVDAEISGFNLTKVDTNSLQLGWEYFDPDFGFNFQIIYMGNEESSFNISGKILDIKNINHIVKRDTSAFYYKFSLAIFYLILFILLVKFLFQEKFRITIVNLTTMLILFILVFVFITSILPNLHMPQNIPL